MALSKEPKPSLQLTCRWLDGNFGGAGGGGDVSDGQPGRAAARKVQPH